MADVDMRLRLVVRRHRLPEARLMWNMRLDNNPTISKLLEQLDKDVPLESDEWGLEDYIVELHDEDGTDFECLHFQTVRSVLKPDDRVFIRPLDRDDHRRRRLSGRDQISTDGRHLIDGVPFGRPRLRSPIGRPPVRIPAFKRRRLGYDQQDSSESDSHPLMITNGEPSDDELEGSADDLSDSAFDFDFDPRFGLDNEAFSSADEDEDDMQQDDEEENDEGALIGDDELAQEALDLARENMELDPPDEGVSADEEARSPQQSLVVNLETSDKILSALSAAFPTAGVRVCQTVLMGVSGDVKEAYNSLLDGFDAKHPLESVYSGEILEDKGQDDPPAQPQNQTASDPKNSDASATAEKASESDGEAGEEEDEEERALKRKFDTAGFPPGTITSGKGLAHMAAASASLASSKLSGASEATSTTLKASPEKQEELDDDDDDDTSSSGSSSPSSDDEEDDDDESSDDEEEEDASDSDSDSSSSDSDNADSSSGDDDNVTDPSMQKSDATDDSSEDETSDGNDSDSGPEERPVGRGSSDAVSSSSNAESSSDDSSSDSSDATEESNAQGSDSESDSTSDSDSDSGDEDVKDAPKKKIKAVTIGNLTEVHEHPKPLQNELQVKTVPPGAGKLTTKKRNARRKARKEHLRAEEDSRATCDKDATVAEKVTVDQKSTADDEAALFEAKRNALLAAIASGGVEVDASGKDNLSNMSTETTGDKRKRFKDWSVGPEHQDESLQNETPQGDERAQDSPSSTSSQKRRRIDLGAGRRLLFGALGLRNPKTKEDEDKLRDKLMKDIKPLMKVKPNDPHDSTIEQSTTTQVDQSDDNWQLKINYRAVECCHDGIELTPAPFPFQQRWDPRQQGSLFRKKNKRGGQSKRAQRNQSLYYSEEGNGSGRKRKHAELGEWAGDDGGYNDTTGADIELNYDDVDPVVEKAEAKVTEMSQATDLDDLPPLPKDLSTLPSLRPGQAQIGMVITWQKWFCSSGTNWQPQLSNVSAIVVSIEEEGATLEVCMAKRDRHLDGNEKRYDEAGQRIYGKFEVPDEDEDEDDRDGKDEGYRTVPWHEMQDPKILQQPLEPTTVIDVDMDVAASGDVIPSIEDGAVVDSKAAMESTGSPTSGQPQENTSHFEPTNSFQSAQASPAGPAHTAITFEPTNDTPEVNGPQEEKTGQLSIGESNATNTSHSHQPGQGHEVLDTPMSDVSTTSSPSRQLHETSQILESASQTDDWARRANVEREESSLPLPPVDASLSRLDNDTQADIIAGTPRAIRVTMPSSDQSVQSGRQPDYSMDVELHVPDSYNATDVDRPSTSGQSPDPHLISPLPENCPSTPKQNRGGAVDHVNGSLENGDITKTPTAPNSARSMSSLDSLTAIFCTAVTSRTTQSPSKTQLSSAMKVSAVSQAQRDSKDDDDDDDDSDDDIPTPRSAVKNMKTGVQESKVKKEYDTEEGSLPPSTAPPTFLRHESSALKKISPPPPRGRGRAASPKQPFIIPAGSQVIEPSSDVEEEEPAYTENYADDDVDKTYSPRVNKSGSSSLPKGEGWVKKLKKRNNNSYTNNRDERRDLLFAKTKEGLKSSQSQSQSRSSFSSSSQPASFVSPRNRRKTSARF